MEVKDPLELHMVTTLSWTDLFLIFHLPVSPKPCVSFRGRKTLSMFADIMRYWDGYCDLKWRGYMHIPIFESHDCIRTNQESAFKMKRKLQAYCIQILYYPNNALNYMNYSIVKNTLIIYNLLRHVSVHAGTIIREPDSVRS